MAKEKEYYAEKRPWGSFERFVHNKKCTVKILTLKPGQALSLQYHKFRSELWVTLDSGLWFQAGKKISTFKKGSVVEIPKNTPHRLMGGKKEARVLEISWGKVRENDIVRIEDRYGRV